MAEAVNETKKMYRMSKRLYQKMNQGTYRIGASSIKLRINAL